MIEVGPRDYKKAYEELVETTALRISQGEQDKNPRPTHYLVPGTDIELIDIIRARMTVGEWQAFCWGSYIQYAYRAPFKGEPGKDANKMITYGEWFRRSVREHGLQMGLTQAGDYGIIRGEENR